MQGISENNPEKYPLKFCDEVVVAAVIKPEIFTKFQKLSATIELAGQVIHLLL